MKTATACFLAVSVVFFVGSASAATTGYTTLTDYLNAGGNPTILLDFDPKATNTVVSGASFSPAVVFFSPENGDTTLVYHVGGGVGNNGCVGGILPGSATFIGKLRFELSTGQQSVAADIRSAGEPVTVQVYGTTAALLLTFVTPAPPKFFGVISDVLIGHVRLTPGTFPAGGLDATCYDNLRFGDVPVQNLPETWGHLKVRYR